jgi:hypothetical protein
MCHWTMLPAVWTNHVGYGQPAPFPAKQRTDQWILSARRFRALLDSTQSALRPDVIVQDQSRRRAIADAPAMSSTSANGHDRNNASDTMSPPGDTGSNAKRRSEDGGSAQPRAKRNRYISIAWYAMGVSGGVGRQG